MSWLDDRKTQIKALIEGEFEVWYKEHMQPILDSETQETYTKEEVSEIVKKSVRFGYMGASEKLLNKGYR